MSNEKQQEEILNYLEEILNYLECSYSGAKMLGDEETMLRLSRAIVAFKADVYTDIFKDDIDLVSLT